MTDKQLAKAIRPHLADSPTATVQDLADATETTVEDVTRVLDEFGPKGASDAEYRGPGLGGGWVEQPEPEAEPEDDD